MFKEHFLLHLLPSLLNINKTDQVLQQNRPLREPARLAELAELQLNAAEPVSIKWWVLASSRERRKVETSREWPRGLPSALVNNDYPGLCLYCCCAVIKLTRFAEPRFGFMSLHWANCLSRSGRELRPPFRSSSCSQSEVGRLLATAPSWSVTGASFYLPTLRFEEPLC